MLPSENKLFIELSYLDSPGHLPALCLQSWLERIFGAIRSNMRWTDRRMFQVACLAGALPRLSHAACREQPSPPPANGPRTTPGERRRYRNDEPTPGRDAHQRGPSRRVGLGWPLSRRRGSHAARLGGGQECRAEWEWANHVTRSPKSRRGHSGRSMR